MIFSVLYNIVTTSCLASAGHPVGVHLMVKNMSE